MNTAAHQLGDEKRALRERVLAWRRALPAEDVARRSRQVIARLMELSAVQQAGTVFCYVSHGGEVETHSLIRNWLAAGKHLQVPSFDRMQRCYHPASIKDFDRDLVAAKMGILEPRAGTTPVGRADVAIVPGVAFDAAGHRLGYGKGYYDTMLRHFEGLKVGLAFDGQIQPAVPQGSGDVPMDVVVTENRVCWRKDA